MQFEQDVAAARERTMELEQEVSTARGRTVALEQEVSAARERALALERKSLRRASARWRSNRQPVKPPSRPHERPARARPPASRCGRRCSMRRNQAATCRSGEARQGGNRARGGSDPGERERNATPVQEEATPESAAANRNGQPSPIVSRLGKYAGTKAAVFILDQVSDAPVTGSTISTYLSDAGWAPQTWKWTGVAEILGVVVLIKEASDPATSEAASTLVEALRSTGLNATKGDWPADWRRFRGALDGPQTPGPTEAPIRIVIGAKPR